MNSNILNPVVQDYIQENIDIDVNKLALAKPMFEGISTSELASQIAARKKAKHKLPTWFNKAGIYFPPLLSIEQTSSEPTAAYKSNLAIGNSLIDLTAGFGVDSFFFAKKINAVVSCEINPELSAISKHNAQVLNAGNISCLAEDGIQELQESNKAFDTIYIDPARRNMGNKVFKLSDCTPDVTQHLDLFLARAQRTIIKTAPLLDITAGLSELRNVSEIHIVSVKNECKELLWVIDRGYTSSPTIVCITLNHTVKNFSFSIDEQNISATIAEDISGYLYEPDVALLKSGAFNLIGKRFNLRKLHQQSQLFVSNDINPHFLGRIFEIKTVLSLNELKKEKQLMGNVIVRNFPESAENLVKKYRITPSQNDFIIFSQSKDGYIAIKATILQHY